MRLPIVFLLSASVLCAQAPITPPLAGWLRDTAGSLRAIYGVAGNFLPGPQVRDGIVTAGFSGAAGAIKTDDTVTLIDINGQPAGEFAAPGGAALFAFDTAGLPAWCYFQKTSQLRPLASGDAVPADLSGLAGTVLSLADGGSQTARMLVARDSALWRITVSASGQVLSEESLPGLPAAGPAMLLHPDTVVVADGSTLVIRRGFSDDQRVTLPAPAQDFERMGDGWIRVGQPDGVPSLALRVAKDGFSLFRLPAAGDQQ